MRGQRSFTAESGAQARPSTAALWLCATGLVQRDDACDAQLLEDETAAVIVALPWAAATHFTAGAAMLAMADPALRSWLGTLVALVLLADAMLCLLLKRGRTSVRTAVGVGRLVTLYGLVVGLAWSLLLVASAAPVMIAQAAALLIGVVLLSPIPPAAVLLALPSVLMAGWRSGSVGMAATLVVLLLLLGVALLVRGRHAQSRGRRRIAVTAETRKARELLAEFEENRSGWFWETDADGRLTYLSPQLAESVGQTVSALVGRPFTDLILAEAAEGADRVRRSAGGERTLGFHLSTRLAFADVAVRAAFAYEPRWWSLSGRPAFDDFGTFLGFRGNGIDLTERRRSEEEINRLARSDALTGLPNRIVMRQTLEASLQAPGQETKPCAVLLLDLDRFKSVNDTLGHPAGDALLRQVSERLQAVVGEVGRVGRLGGDEFKLVLPGIVDRTRVAEIATAVIDAVSSPYEIDGSHVSIGASVGIAIAPDDGASADSLIRNADLALYAAKADGRGVHRFYQPAMHANAKDRRQLEIDLRTAFSEGGFHLAYQPVVNIETETIVGFEALLRWNHPTRGAVSPALFVPIAEEIGLIPQIGEWVLRTACADAVQWPDPVRVAVNISPIQFASPALPATVVSALASAGLPAGRLELEITEGVFLNDSEATDTMFAQLKAIGVRFALDDFGTGYSSLGYLRKAPFNKIKIDQSFVRGAAIAGNRNAAIIKAIVALAESLDMETTAEGAETHDELDLIRTLGCSHVQGYIFGKPMLAAEARQRTEGLETLSPDGFLTSRSPRTAVLRSAILHHRETLLPVRIRNISAKGALIEGLNASIEIDEPVELELSADARYAATVRWVQDGRGGVMFEAGFELDRLSAPKPRAAVRRPG